MKNKKLPTIEMRYMLITLQDGFGGTAKKEDLLAEIARRYAKYPIWYIKLMGLFYPLTKFHWKD